MFQHGHVGHARIFCDTDVVGERPQRARGHAAPAQPGNGQHARIVPAVHEFIVHELDELSLAHDRVSQIKPCKFILMRPGPRHFDGIENPFVKRPVHFEFQSANRMCNPLDVITQRMRPIVHRVNAPFVASPMMRGVPDAVEHRIAQPHVGRAHVDLRSQRARAIREFARFHAREEIEVFFDRTIAKRTFLAEPAILVGLLRGHVANECLILAHQFNCAFVKSIEIIRGVEGGVSI